MALFGNYSSILSGIELINTCVHSIHIYYQPHSLKSFLYKVGLEVYGSASSALSINIPKNLFQFPILKLIFSFYVNVVNWDFLWFSISLTSYCILQCYNYDYHQKLTFISVFDCVLCINCIVCLSVCMCIVNDKMHIMWHIIWTISVQIF